MRLDAGETAPVRVGEPNTQYAINATITQPEAAGHVTAWPCSEAMPDASILNYAPGQTIANTTILTTDENGDICFNTLASAHFIADVNGQVNGTSQTPERLFDSRDGGIPEENTDITKSCMDGIYPEFNFVFENDRDELVTATYYSNLFEPYDITYNPNVIQNVGFSVDPDPGFISTQFLIKRTYQTGFYDYEWLNNGNPIEVACNGVELPPEPSPVIGLPVDAPQP